MSRKLPNVFARQSRALALAAAAVGLSSLFTTGAVAQTATREAAKPKPTIVLVHGAFADSSSWNLVITRLQRQGYPVIALPNPLRGITSDSAYIASELATVRGPIVLVAHSYGGAVITNAATGNPNVKALVYIAALIPDAGETATCSSSLVV
jgi:pimeloyl-ACP methyl ester carboxylesterase